MTPRRPYPPPFPAVALVVALTLALCVGVLAGCGGARRTVAADAPSPPSPTASAPTASVSEAPRSDRLPDDLALDHGLSADDSDLALEGPGRDVAAVSFRDLCDPDPTSWPGAAQDRLTVELAGPEYLVQRELLLYDTAAAAQEVLDALAAQLASCPEVRGTDPAQPGARRYLLLEPTGERVLTFGMHYLDGLGSTVWLVERRGRLLLLAASYGEGSRESLPGGGRDLARTHEPLWDALERDLPPALLR